MLLRAAIVFLLVLNLGIAAWWISGGNRQSAPIGAQAPTDVPRLRLVGETAAVPAAAPAVRAAAGSSAPVAGASPTAMTAAVGQCLRYGPFADAAARAAANAALSSAGVTAVPRDTASGPSRGWKVHVQAFASRAEADAMGERIRAAGISDWYVMSEGDAANSVALGRYGSEAAARRREAELKAKGIPAVAEAVGGSAAQAWLEARLPANADRAALAAVAPSESIDCATLR
jgi:cell division septation protein DedD